MNDHTPYMVALDLAGRRCVVVGGGAVAERKVRGLFASGAAVVIVAPTLTDALHVLATAGELTAIRRPYRSGDLDGAALVIAATDRREVNAQVAADARAANIPVNVADNPADGTFALPAIARRGSVTVAISTAGGSPLMAALARDRIAAALSDRFVALLDGIAEMRRELRGRGVSIPPHIWHAAVTPAVLAIAEAGDVVGAVACVGESLTGAGIAPPEPHKSLARNDGQEVATGFVSLVGAGPGDPGLLTVRGRERLQAADVVIYDRLLDPHLLDLAPPDAERIYVGKGPTHHAHEQPDINALLVAHGQAGRRVVRLKGGDPFVFGRGGEEADALAAAGIPFEIVPGISSAIAVPAYAGIPVTHRHVSTSFTVLTGHDTTAHADWAALARGGTLVFLMGVGSLPIIAEKLVGAGLAPDTPAAAIEWGTWERQRVVTGTVSDLHTLIIAAGIGAPATVVIGEVVRLRERLRWFDRERETNG